MTDGTCHADLDQYGCIATFHVADVYSALIMIAIDASLFATFCYKCYQVMQIFRKSEKSNKIPIKLIESFIIQFLLTSIAMCSCVFDAMMHLIFHDDGHNYHITMIFFLFDCTVVATCNFSMISESQAIIRKFICCCCHKKKSRTARGISCKSQTQKTSPIADSSKGIPHPSRNSTVQTTTDLSQITNAERNTSVHIHNYRSGQADPVPSRSRTNSINPGRVTLKFSNGGGRITMSGIGPGEVVMEVDPLPDIAPKFDTKITDFEEDDMHIRSNINGLEIEQIDIEMSPALTTNHPVHGETDEALHD